MYRYQGFAEKYLDAANIVGEQVMVRCIWHDDTKPSMHFHLEKGQAWCFSCHQGGGIKKIEQRLGIRAIAGEYDVTSLRDRLNEIDKPKQDMRVKPDSTLRRYSFPTTYWTEQRKLTPETVAMFDLGYDPLGDRVGGPYVTIPIRSTAGDLLGVIKRYLDDTSPLRYLYPKGFKKSDHLFGSWLLAADDLEIDTLVLVEGSIDAMKCWQAGYPAAAILGSYLSAHQCRIVQQLDVQNVVLFFDNDDAGRSATSSALGFRKSDDKWRYDAETDLRRTSAFVSRAVYPRGRATDPGSMSSRKIQQAVETAVPLSGPYMAR